MILYAIYETLPSNSIGVAMFKEMHKAQIFVETSVLHIDKASYNYCLL